ncbi:hypothetical protein DACRYDRAFT_99097 [Dacryopinax primogenitus]|uniref:ARM repeat-containing protein n=1 Tax=Dacryopinax primogenitus (strain DJM 731) TaxID=1858805 RepID=M5G8M0_DACPD|nr:uncharacterized protein DACRYDRAFT_99097 [Dacryopinax primogenitus]EJU04525.1 hypothetical protein DACRYDRAFT_99097 [Dacryopinax primogenitus]
MSYYRGPPPQQRGRYNYVSGSYPNGNAQQQGGQQRRDDRNFRGERVQPAYSQPQQYAQRQPQSYTRPIPSGTKSPRTEAKDILDDVRSSQEQRARAFKTLMDSARDAPHSTRSVSSLTSAFALFASEQQEEVIDFVYDLCEDPNSAVRIQGYHTIVELSKAVPSWTRRNADVLVQLLQSDSSTELRVIREALISHIQTDPVAAFEVITEHLTRAGEAEDESGEASMGSLKRLVLEFLTTPDVTKTRHDKLTSGSSAEASFNRGVSEALLHSSRRDAKQLLSLLQSLPSWTSQKQPNPFRTQSITSLLERAITLSQRGGAFGDDESLALYTLAQEATEGGNGDPRAFVRFWARMSWKDWNVAEHYEYGRSVTLQRWLKASITVWKDLRREDKADVPAFDEKILARDVAAVTIDLLNSAAATFEKAGAANQENMWAFVDVALANIFRLCETHMDLQPVRDAFGAGPISKMLHFAYETKNMRGSGLSAESMRLLISIVSKSGRVYSELEIRAPYAEDRQTSSRVSNVSPSPGVKRKAEGHQMDDPLAARPPVKIDRDRPSKDKLDGGKDALSMIRSTLIAAEASPLPHRDRGGARTATPDLLTSSRLDSSSENRPLKRPKLSTEGTDSNSTRSASLFERIHGVKPQSGMLDTNDGQPSAVPPQSRSLAERLGVDLKRASTRTTNADDNFTIRGAASLASRLSRPATSASLLDRIGGK